MKQLLRRPARRSTLIAAWAASLLVAATGTATAAGMITGANIVDGTIRSIDIKDGSVGWNDMSKGAKARLINAAKGGATVQGGGSGGGADGAKGEKGDAGTNGTNGANGSDGSKGDDGAPGLKGDDGQDGQDGADGAPATQEYAVFSLYVDRQPDGERFKSDSTPWATIATPTVPDGGIPATTNGTFSVSCRPNHGTIVANDYCLVAIRGAVRSNEATGARLVARVVVNSHGDTLRGGAPAGVVTYGSEGENNAAPLSVDSSPLSSTAPTQVNGSLLTLSWGNNSLTGGVGTVLLEDGSNGLDGSPTNGTPNSNIGTYLKLPASAGSGYQITLTGIAVDA